MTIEAMATCPGSRHAATRDAYRHGCRHPEAIAAHDQWLNGHPCTADRHHSNVAWLLGCRSDLACAAHQHAVDRKRGENQRRMAAERMRRDAARQLAYDQRDRRTYTKTGGRLTRDPRVPWRSGKMLVDRNNLRHLLHGFWDAPTVGEVLAAVAHTETRIVQDSAFRSRRINNQEIADRLHLGDDRRVYRTREMRRRLRDQRTERRLADVTWKAAVVAEAPARAERERAKHEQAHARKLARKQDARTMRRLRQSQERAKRVALAIERRALCA